MKNPSSGVPTTTPRQTKTDFLSQYHDTIEEDDFPDFETLKVGQNEDQHTLKGADQRTFKGAKGAGLFTSPMDSMSTSSPKLRALGGTTRGIFNINKSNGTGDSSSSRHITKKSLSEYSEGDTDITSQMNEDDFEDLDNIFGAEESGIYDKMSLHLHSKQLELQQEATLEELELRRKYDMRRKFATQDTTLKLTNLNLTLLDQLEDFEHDDFTTGFDNDFERVILSKKSLPNLAYKLKNDSQPQSFNQALRKNKSIAAIGYNHDNKVLRKLDRIPLFYHKPEKQERPERAIPERAERAIPERRHESRNAPDSKRNSILSKYSEASHVNRKPNHRKSMGFVSNDYSQSTQSLSMKFNPTALRWEGNEVDLLRFEHKPSLITLKEYPKKDNRNPNMIYDNEKMCWINLDDVEATVFGDIPDLEVSKAIPQREFKQREFKLQGEAKLKQAEFKPPPVPQLKPPASVRASMKNMREHDLRGISHSTQRTVSSGNGVRNSTNERDRVGDEFVVGGKMMERFKKEEEKILKKTGNWFVGEEGVSKDYYWEIRRMVME